MGLLGHAGTSGEPPTRLSVKVQEKHYLWKPTVSNLGQLYPAPIEVKLVTWEQA